MTNLIRIPANTRARVTVARDDIVDKFDVVGMQFKFLGGAFPAAWAYYKFEEPDESELWVDATGQGHHLRRNLGYEAIPTSTVGKINNGISFAGSQPIVIDNEDEEGYYFKSGIEVTDPFSWSAWAKVGGSSTYNDLLDFNIEYVYLWIQDDGSIMYYPCYDYPGHEVSVDCTGSLHHIVVTSDGATVKLYVDNTLVDTYEITEDCDCAYLSWLTSIALGISHRASGESILDELGLWLVELTPAQIAQLWNSGNGWSPY